MDRELFLSSNEMRRKGDIYAGRDESSPASSKLYFSMKLRFLLLFLLSTALSDTLHAQLITWRDLIDDDLLQPDKRIYYGPDSLQFGDLWIP